MRRRRVALNRTEEKIACAIAETPMPDAVRAELVERLAEDLSDRASFSRTGWLLACTARVAYAEVPAEDRSEAAWLGRIACGAWLFLRGWQDREQLEADVIDFISDDACKPKLRKLLLEMSKPPLELV